MRLIQRNRSLGKSVKFFSIENFDLATSVPSQGRLAKEKTMRLPRILHSLAIGLAAVLVPTAAAATEASATTALNGAMTESGVLAV